MSKSAQNRLNLISKHIQPNQTGSNSTLITVLNSPHAPKAVGPFSHGIKVSPNAHLVFASGQVGVDPKVLKNLEQVLKEGGCTFENVVKANAYLADIGDYAKFNEAYAQFFKGDYPARVCLAVKSLPRNAKVEIDFIAVTNK